MASASGCLAYCLGSEARRDGLWIYDICNADVARFCERRCDRSPAVDTSVGTGLWADENCKRSLLVAQNVDSCESIIPVKDDTTRFSVCSCRAGDVVHQNVGQYGLLHLISAGTEPAGAYVCEPCSKLANAIDGLQPDFLLFCPCSVCRITIAHSRKADKYQRECSEEAQSHCDAIPLERL